MFHYANGRPDVLLERNILLGVFVAVCHALRDEPELHMVGEQCGPYVGQQAI